MSSDGVQDFSNMVAMADSHQNPEELDTIVEITGILTGRLSFLEKCESTLAALARFTGADLVILREWDPDNSKLDLVASYNFLVPPEDIRMSISVSTGMASETLRTGIPAVVNNYPAKETLIQGYLDSGVKSSMVLPVLIDAEIFGTLSFASRFLDHFQEDTVRMLVAVGAVVGMMIAKAGLQEINEAEAKISGIVSSTLVGPDVFERFAEEAAEIIEFERVALNSLDLANNAYTTEFLIGEQIPDFVIGKAIPIDGTAMEIVVRSRTSQIFRLDDREGAKPRFPRAGLFVSSGQPYLISVPLIVGDQVIGTMGFNRGSGPFTGKDLAKAARLGNLVAGAFADFKQREFRVEAEREIAKNKAILEAEAAIGKILSSPREDSDVIDAMRLRVDKIIPTDRLVIMSVDLKAETFSQEFNEIFNNLDEMVASIVGQPYSGSITAEVIRTGAGQIVNSDDDRISSGELPLAQIVIDHGYSSILAVPLEFEGTINGTVVCSRLDGQYCEEDLITAGRISALLAGGLATFKIAAERDRAQLARSESEARGRIILEAEAAIGRILSVPLSRPGASEALISEIANVISLDHVVIVAVDLDTETFSPDFTEFLHDLRLMVVGNYGKLYAGSITAEVVKHGTGQIINSDDPRLVSGSLPIVQEMFGRGYRTMMAVPLVFEGNIIGTLILLSLRERIQQIRHGHSGPNRYHAGRRSRYFQIVH